MPNRFASAVARCAEFEGHLLPGIQALRHSDRAKIRVDVPRRLPGSVAIDDALCESLPNEPRWDYVIGATSAAELGERAFFVEVHPASAGEIKAVEAKLDWLKSWIGTHARDLDRMPREFVWIASGKVRFSPHSPALRSLAMKGCKFAGRSFSLE